MFCTVLDIKTTHFFTSYRLLFIARFHRLFLQFLSNKRSNRQQISFSALRNCSLVQLYFYSPAMASMDTNQVLICFHNHNVLLLSEFHHSLNSQLIHTNPHIQDRYSIQFQMGNHNNLWACQSLILIYSFTSLPLSIRLRLLYPGQILNPFLVSLNNAQCGYNATIS
uniref:Uncharacterized protein n=1 Tax=Siphoviridae sp. ctGMq5 TaxID=2826220 RepID=A0A8S5NPH2_9CAUD|nr:MAG TPA: hypothetical protein [Siphoviridae sp. ctGMq5]